MKLGHLLWGTHSFACLMHIVWNLSIFHLLNKNYTLFVGHWVSGFTMYHFSRRSPDDHIYILENVYPWLETLFSSENETTWYSVKYQHDRRWDEGCTLLNEQCEIWETSLNLISTRFSLLILLYHKIPLMCTSFEQLLNLNNLNYILVHKTLQLSKS